jgi:hypothetical protein
MLPSHSYGASRAGVVRICYPHADLWQARMRRGEGSRYGAITVQVAAAAVPFWSGGAVRAAVIMYEGDDAHGYEMGAARRRMGERGGMGAHSQ